MLPFETPFGVTASLLIVLALPRVRLDFARAAGSDITNDNRLRYY
jgi:hypothetical protein